MNTQLHIAHNRRPIWLASLTLILMLVLAACQPAAEIPATGSTATAAPQPSATTAAPAASPTAEAAAEAEINVYEDPNLGPILVGNNGMTLYMFTKDEPNKSNCSGDCLAAWPPLVTQSEPVLGEGVDASLVGMADLPDGSKIVTYNGMPLYYWASDKQEGDVTGQGVGEVWYVVSPEGDVIGMGEPAGAAAGDTDISVAENDEFGKFLVGKDGMSLYMFTKDEPNMSNCSGDCLANWPPLVADGEPVLGEGVDQSLVGSADLADGSKIVTYNGMPLYYWVKDTQAGDTTGQGVGEVWYLVSPEGEVIGMDEQASPTSSGNAAATDEDEAEISVVKDPTLGEILVGHDGMTLYMFTKDEPNKSNCSGDCLAKWPPLLTMGSPKLDDGIDASLVGEADLPDGSKIVTYNGMPLYYWVNDKQAGDTTGQGVGGVWYVVSPEGEVIGQ